LAIIHQIRRQAPVRNADSVAVLCQIASCDETSGTSSRIDRAAASIVTEMKKLHGGNWETRIDHQRRLVMVWAIDQ
jgi:hypothetical protein